MSPAVRLRNKIAENILLYYTILTLLYWLEISRNYLFPAQLTQKINNFWAIFGSQNSGDYTVIIRDFGIGKRSGIWD